MDFFHLWLLFYQALLPVCFFILYNLDFLIIIDQVINLINFNMNISEKILELDTKHLNLIVLITLTTRNSFIFLLSSFFFEYLHFNEISNIILSWDCAMFIASGSWLFLRDY